MHGWEVAGDSAAGDVGGGAVVHGDATALVNAAAAQVGGVHQAVACRAEAGYEGIGRSAERALESVGRRGEVW